MPATKPGTFRRVPSEPFTLRGDHVELLPLEPAMADVLARAAELGRTA